MIKYIVLLIVGYLAGCFQTAYIIGKTNKHIDIRQHGSGNSGTTNALRVMGIKFGVLTFIGDFLKAFLTVLVVLLLFHNNLYAVVAGLGVILGHDFPVFLGFRGGKGIASTIGIAFALDYRAGLLCVGILILVIGIGKMVSLGSIILCAALPIYFGVFHNYSVWEIGLIWMIAILGVVQHRDNIKRLINGTEVKISWNKKKTS